MGEHEVKEYLKKAKQYIGQISSSKNQAQKFLKDTKVYTSSGKLSTNYK